MKNPGSERRPNGWRFLLAPLSIRIEAHRLAAVFLLFALFDP
jgi:hypothetical protein